LSSAARLQVRERAADTFAECSTSAARRRCNQPRPMRWKSASTRAAKPVHSSREQCAASASAFASSGSGRRVVAWWTHSRTHSWRERVEQRARFSSTRVVVDDHAAAMDVVRQQWADALGVESGGGAERRGARGAVIAQPRAQLGADAFVLRGLRHRLVVQRHHMLAQQKSERFECAATGGRIERSHVASSLVVGCVGALGRRCRGGFGVPMQVASAWWRCR
jgi:hypothetical protein